MTATSKPSESTSLLGRLVSSIRQQRTNMSQRGDASYSSEMQQAQVEVPLNSHWQEIFRKYDLDNDGRISLTELRAMIKSESYENDIPEHTVRMIMEKADEDASGYLDIREFEKMVHTKEFRSLMGHMVSAYIRSTIVPRKHLDVTDARGDYEDEYSCSPPSVCMLLISVLEIVTYLWDVIAEGNHSANGPAARVFIYDPKKRYEVWRYATYMFVHVGVMHIAVNLLVQVLLGTPLEMVHRWWRVLIIYFAGVLAGSLGTSISDPKVYLAGASGGVYALITAHVSSIVMNWSEMRFALLQLVVFFILTASDIGTAIYNRYVLNAEDRIGYAAHLAGALAGLLVGINVLRNLQVKKWEKVIWWISLITYCVLMLAAIIWNLAYPSYFPVQE